MKRFLLSFVYAGRGLWYCARHERNFRIHLTAALYVLAFAPSFSLSRGEWSALLVMIALVAAAEGINTAIERAVDLNGKNPHPLARIAKDTAAGAVLFCALAAVGVAGILFWRPEELAALAGRLLQTPWKLAALALSVPLSLWFIFRGGVQSKNSLRK